MGKAVITMKTVDDELRNSLRDLPRTSKFDFRYPIDAYEDDLVALITLHTQKRELMARIDELNKLKQYKGVIDTREYFADRIAELKEEI